MPYPSSTLYPSTGLYPGAGEAESEVVVDPPTHLVFAHHGTAARTALHPTRLLLNSRKSSLKLADRETKVIWNG